jgi:hypothetical protein
MHRFFFYGCWNRDNCSGADYRLAVIDALYQQAKNFDFGIIAGDNVYPHKIKTGTAKTKSYYAKTLSYAFDAMQRVRDLLKSKKIFAVLGNHDVATPGVLKAQLNHTTFEMPSNIYTVSDSQLRLIFIDTNLLQLDGSIPKAYKNTDEEISNFLDKDVNDGATLMVWLSNKLKEPHSGWTVVVGHEPIKTKKASKDQELMIANEIIKMLSESPNTVYMCADTHNFQAVQLSTDSHATLMIVAGTGGADPDPSLPVGNKGNGYNLIASESPFGYCDVVCTSKKLTITYRHLPGCGSAQNDVTIVVHRTGKTRGAVVHYFDNDHVNEPGSIKCGAKSTVESQCTPLGEVLNGGKRPKRTPTQYRTKNHRIVQ